MRPLTSLIISLVIIMGSVITAFCSEKTEPSENLLKETTGQISTSEASQTPGLIRHYEKVLTEYRQGKWKLNNDELRTVQMYLSDLYSEVGDKEKARQYKNDIHAETLYPAGNISVKDLGMIDAKAKVDRMTKEYELNGPEYFKRMTELADMYKQSQLQDSAAYVYSWLVNGYVSNTGARLRDNEYALRAACKIVEIHKATETGRQWYKKILREYAPDEATSLSSEDIAELTQNYSDYNGEPLKMFLESAHQLPYCNEIVPHLYAVILSRYPSCKLAPYLKFRLGGMDLYRELVRNHPDSVFPFKKKVKLAPVAQMKIAYIYSSKENSLFDIPNAIEEFGKVIKNYPADIQDESGFDLKINAYIELLGIYTDWWYGVSFKNTEKARQIIETLLRLPNQDYLAKEWWVGRTHPECYLRLGDIEREAGNIAKSRILYQKVLKEFPNIWTGKRGSDDSSPYVSIALQKLLNIEKDNHQNQIAQCAGIIAGDYDKSVKAFALYSLAVIYAESNQTDKAKEEYQKVIRDYADIYADGEWTFGQYADDGLRSLNLKVPEATGR